MRHHAPLVISFCVTCWAICAVLSPCSGQITFERTYGGINSDRGYAVEQTPDGGYIVVGQTLSFGVGGLDVYVVRTDSFGNTVWAATLGGSGDDVGRCVCETGDGGYIVTGSTESTGAGSLDVYLAKIDSLGNPIWESTYGGSGADWGGCVRQTSDGGYIIAGYTSSFGSGAKDLYMVKTDSLGGVIWDVIYGGPLDDWGYSVQQTLDGGYIAVGATESSGAGSLDVYIVRTDYLGDSLWSTTYGGLSNDAGHCVQETQDGDYVIAGFIDPLSGSDYDILLMKIDSSGSTVWSTTHGGIYAEWGYWVTETQDGGYAVAGMTWSFGAGWTDVYLVKTDSLGQLLWGRTYGGSAFDWGFCVCQTSDGGYIVSGHTPSFGAGESDVYLIKTDENGLTGIEEASREPSVSRRLFRLRQNTPNPIHQATLISYSLPHTAHITLSIYDITGRLVETLVNETQQRGVHQVQWNRKANPSGVYFYRLNAGEFVETRKMVVVE